MTVAFLTKDEQAALWGRMEAGDESAIPELIAAYEPLAAAMARRQAVPSHVDREDLKSNAMIGLYQAVTRFDPSTSDGNYAKHFSSFAKRRISGQILDYIKSKEVSWAPRGVYRDVKNRHAMEEELQQKLGRHPSDAEVAEHMGVAIADLPRIAIQIPMASGQPVEEGGGLDAIASDLRVDDVASIGLLADRMAQAINSLDEDVQLVLWTWVVRAVPTFKRLPDGLTQGDFDDAFVKLRIALRSESIMPARRCRNGT